ncbi:MerR family transcriptional regulator [Priestia megaterium]|uniref:MerR family transcriptional regulator n=1 Tax=Priestia megaterium TaxID=1404 RepID=UPI000BEE1B71|nr:MerR family transcriptional regulator [Priestia megaterium]MDW4510266.1 MerR family transcriptional regulator [Priestia megaterium]PEC44513.1 BltR family transcriptional regulator [Priestia megaterium]
MSEELEKYFTTGEFANLCHVKKQTLFHYDEIGLLSPKIKKENGYRYYSYDQFEVFQLIALFKEFGIPLKEIRILLTDKKPRNMITLLKEKSFEIEEKIKNLNHLQAIIQTRLQLAEHALQTDFSSISLQSLDEENFMISENILEEAEQKYTTVIPELIHYIQLHKLDRGYPIGALLAREQIQKKEFYNYKHLYVKIPEGIEKVHYHTRPRGLYAVGYQKGAETEHAYNRMIQFVEEKGLKIGEYAYEEYVIDEVSADGIENSITRIQLQIQSY